LSISKKRKLPGIRDQHLRASGFQQRGKGGSFGATHGSVIAGLRGAVGIGALVPVGRCLKVAGIQDASRVKPGNGGEVVRLHVRNHDAR